MRFETSIVRTATLACLLLAGQASTRAIEPGVPSPVFGVDFLRLLEGDLDAGPVSSSIPSSEAFRSWVKGSGAVLSVAPTGLDGPPDALAGLACDDLVTGGGSIPVGSSIGTFGGFAGVKDDLIFVGFEYTDHDADFHVKVLSISTYGQGATADCRHFEGGAAINGVSGFTYSVDVRDNAEPGTGVDTFAISLSNGYSASGVLAGGNVQVHVFCP